ncbi:MAG: MFS transporter [Vulcanimicrobiota bacterium]
MEEEKSAFNPLKEITQPFIDLFHAPRALWVINISNFLEGLVYFGILTLLVIFLNDYIKLDDVQAGKIVSYLTAGITLSMLFLGGLADRWGVKKALIVALIFMLAGRLLLIEPYIASSLGGWFSGIGGNISKTGGMYSPLFWITCGGLLLVVIGYGTYQPALYAGVKKFTDEKTASMGYAMLYAVMNLGGFMPALISPPIRKSYGIVGVFELYVLLTLLGLLVVWILMPKEKKAVPSESDSSEDRAAKAVIEEPSKGFSLESCLRWLREHPLADSRFTFFIFILIPVQTLFAHNWLTLPPYVDRAYSGIVSQNMEFFVNINPLLIFVLTPLVAAITRKADVYKMMIAGTFVMAVPTFFLALGPNVLSLFAYIFLMSVGEAMWQPRFLQFVAEIAPEGKTGAYMGIAQFPWFLTKFVTGLYSGWFLTHYCPKGGQQHTEMMWLIYGLIAMITPFCLLIFGSWAKKSIRAGKRNTTATENAVISDAESDYSEERHEP